MSNFAVIESKSSEVLFSDQLSDGLIWGKSIVFSNYPKHVGVSLPIGYDSENYEEQEENENEEEMESPHYIIIYSQLYQEFVVENSVSRNKFAKSLIPPHLVQTGDILQTGGYRGVGSYYAVWLSAGLFNNPDSLKFEKIRKAQRVEAEAPTATKDEEKEEDIDLLAPYALSKETIMALKKAFLKWDCNENDLRPILESTAPELLAKLPDDTLRNYILCYRVQGDSGASRGEEVAWNELLPEDLASQDFEGFVTYEADRFFQGIPDMEFPQLKPRKVLSHALRQRPWMELYLFEHVDEMGYAAPTAVSMAPLRYFNSEYDARFIDLALLPSPLQQNTCCGYVLHNIRDRLPQDGDADNEEGEEGRKSKTGTSSSLPTIAFIDFEGEDGIFWSDIDNCGSTVIFTKPNPMDVTREMFRKHAEAIRLRLLALHPSNETATEEEIQSLFDQLLWN